MNSLRIRMAGMAILLMLTFFAGCSRNGQAKEEAGRPVVAVEAVRVKAGVIREAIEVVGVLAPKNQTEIKPESVAVVRKVFVREWVRVKKGDILAQMDFAPAISADLKLMDARLFREEPMGLSVTE